MQREVEKLLELAAIDLGFALLEVELANEKTESLGRIGYHLNEIEKHLDNLARAIERGEAKTGKRNA